MLLTRALCVLFLAVVALGERHARKLKLPTIRIDDPLKKMSPSDRIAFEQRQAMFEHPIVDKINNAFAADNCTCTAGVFAGQSCKFSPLKSYSITEQEVCENLGEITGCTESSLSFNFYEFSNCNANREVIEKTLSMGTCHAVPHVNEFSIKVYC